MSEAHDDPVAQLLTLTQALGAHLEALKATGVRGVAPAPGETWQALEALYRDDSVGRSARASTAAGDRARSGPAATAPRSAPRSSATAEPRATPAQQVAPPTSPGPVVSAPPPRTPVDRETARRALAVLEQGVKGCEKCGLSKGRTQTVFARGTGESGLCFVGEGPGADEDAQGLPFVGKAGQLLDRMIVAMGLSRDDVYVCNIVKCRPPDNRKPEPDEMSACMPYLTEQLELVAPQVIVALGATAVQGLLGTTGGITRLRGRWRLYQGKIPVMPTFHPAYLLRNPRAKRDVWDDLKAVLQQMGRPVPARG